jgi:electron transfer flavoprotein alpha subunit
MESILVLTHADETGSSLSKASLEAITAGQDLAARLGATLAIGIVAADATTLSKGLPSTKLLAVCGEAFAQPRYTSDAAACEALCRAAGASIVLVPAGARFSRVAAGVAHRLDGVIDTHITAINAGAGGLETNRWFYRQRVEAVLTRDARPWFLLLDAGTHAPFVPGDSSAQIEDVAVTLPALRTIVTGIQAPKQDEQTIRPDAKMLFVTGAGWTKKQPDGQTHVDEAGDLILAFLRATSASLGSSKSLVDQGGDGNSAHESDRPDGLNAASRKRPFHLLSR